MGALATGSFPDSAGAGVDFGRDFDGDTAIVGRKSLSQKEVLPGAAGLTSLSFFSRGVLRHPDTNTTGTRNRIAQTFFITPPKGQLGGLGLSAPITHFLT
jgi:hypothetical protein